MSPAAPAHPPPADLQLSRRQFFGRTSAGIGGAALASLLNPIDMDPLPSLLFPGMKLTIAFDDVSLPLPKMSPRMLVEELVS